MQNEDNAFCTVAENDNNNIFRNISALYFILEHVIKF